MATRQARRRQNRIAQTRGTGKRKTTPWYLGPWGLLIAVAAVIVVVGVVIYEGSRPSSNAAGTAGNFINKPVPAAVMAALTKPSPSVLKKVGAGGNSNPLTVLPGHPKALTLGGKPEVFYYGAEFCPYCAGERWGLINALSRFGTFSNLHLMKSTVNDVYPATNSFTFLHISYRSKYLSFAPKEVEDRAGQPLQSLTSQENAIIKKYNPKQNFPFIDLGNRASAGDGVLSADLHTVPSDSSSAALSWTQIVKLLKNPSTAASQTVYGNGNWLTAGMCKLTGNKPASTCSMAPIPKLESQLKFHK